jgi:PAS domain S-box-containing protein
MEMSPFNGLLHEDLSWEGTCRRLRQQAAAPALDLLQARALLDEALAQQEALLRENQRLAESQARLHAAETVANLGNELDIATGVLQFSDGMYRLFGEAPGAFTPTKAWLDARSHPADVALVQHVLDEAMREKRPYRYTRHIRRLDGQWRTLESHGRVVCDAAGQVLRLEGIVQDNTEQQRAAQALRASEAQFQLFVTASSDVVYKMSADWQQLYHLVGQEFLADTRTRTTSWLDAYIPAEDQPDVTARIARAIETKSLFEHEHRVLRADGSVGWMHSRAVPVFSAQGDVLEWVGTASDITRRKQAEQELRQNLRLLEQSEQVAGLGSWGYELATGELRLSVGLYHLFSLVPGTPVAPTFYLEHVVAEDRPAAERLVHAMTTASADLEETLRLRVGDQERILRVKTVVVRDEAGQPARVLGVDLDISRVRQLEEENLQLRLCQQQDVFEAVQTAQQVERRRIAEGLHNGVGQLLFATKLRLDQLHAPVLNTAPALVQARQEADQLLAEAIRQTRVLSHELAPLVLEEFGLPAALQDLCHKFTTSRLRIECHVQLDAALPPLPAPLQRALYRLTQELVLHIVQHARGATTASLEVETELGFALLRAVDNGAGFAPDAVVDGRGLRSVRDRVTLLGGTLEVGSAPQAGAYVRIRLPVS